MALSTKSIKKSIKSIQSTKKMTKAMELVAASKMRKAVENVIASGTYADMAWDMLKRLRIKTDSRLHKLLQEKKEVKRVLIILLTSNRGLCGGHNAQIIEKAIKSCRVHKDVAQTDFILVGKKGKQVAHKFRHEVIAYFDKEDVINQISEIYPISGIVFNEYLEGKYDKVLIAYTDFISTLKQQPRVRQILPLTERDEYIGEVSSGEPIGEALADGKKEVKSIQEKGESAEDQENTLEYIFEPTPDQVLAALLPRLIEIQLYQAYMEANASEHSARMMAMKNANEAAGDMIDDLTLSFNKARQAAITQEIAEISAGRAVLES